MVFCMIIDSQIFPGCGGFGCRYCRWCFGPSLGWGSFSSWAFACWLMRRGARPRGCSRLNWICWDVPIPRYGAVWHCMTWNDQSKRIMTGISSSYCNSRIAQNIRYCVAICAMCYWYIRICSNTLWGLILPELGRVWTHEIRTFVTTRDRLCPARIHPPAYRQVVLELNAASNLSKVILIRFGFVRP